MKKILIITRCSRLDFLEHIQFNILHVLKHYNYRWHIIFDLNRVKMTPHIMNLLDIWKKQMDDSFEFTFSGSNDTLYGSNLANEVLNNPINDDCNFVYLLDDDNRLHTKFAGMFDKAKDDEILFFSQIRMDKQANIFQPYCIEDNINSDNAVGYVDSAQFILPIPMLKSIGGYVDGYCIDGLTISKLLEQPREKRCILTLASYYNWFTELNIKLPK